MVIIKKLIIVLTYKDPNEES